MRTEIKVGIFVIIGLSILGYLLLKIESLPWVKPEGYTVKVEFSSIAGLETNADVRLAGYKVGKVSHIRLTDKGTVEVDLMIDPMVKLYSDAKAAVGTIGLLGEKYIEVSSGTLTNPQVLNGGWIEGLAPTSIDQMVAVMNSIGAEVDNMVHYVRDVIGSEESQKGIRQFFATWDKLSSTLMELSDTNKEKINQAFDRMVLLTDDLRVQVPHIIENIKNFSQSIDDVIEENRADLREGITNIKKVGEQLDESLRTLNEILSRIKKGEGTIGGLVYDDEVRDDVKSTIRSVSETASETRNIVRGFGSLDLILGVKTDYYFDSSNFKTYFGLGFSTRGNRLFMLELIDDQVGRRVTSTRLTETIDSTGAILTSQVRTTTQETGFLISAQIGQRFNQLLLRGGLIESEFGAGLDLIIAQERMSFSFDAFNFGRDDNPHCRFRVNFFPYGGFFVSGGYDDFLNKENRQLFFGAGYRF
ncbi:MAG: MlaD family protein [Candidatus Aminicenantes bacterium]|nr:MlaD family protein [Candidatus Aminicenantes bacterium]